jgi:hypothetical protein
MRMTLGLAAKLSLLRSYLVIVDIAVSLADLAAFRLATRIVESHLSQIKKGLISAPITKA